MTFGHSLALLAIILLALVLFLRPREQELRIHPASAQSAPPTACTAPAQPIGPCAFRNCHRRETGEMT